MNIGEKILKIRKDNKMSQDDLAEALNVTRQTVSNWENSKNYPDIETLALISKKFNISLDELLKNDTKMIKTIDKKVRRNKLLLSGLIIIFIIFITSTVYFVTRPPKVVNYVSKDSNIVYMLIPKKIIKDYNLELKKGKRIDISLINVETKEAKAVAYNVEIIGDTTDTNNDSILIAYPDNETAALLYGIIGIAKIKDTNNFEILVNYSTYPNQESYTVITNSELQDFIRKLGYVGLSEEN